MFLAFFLLSNCAPNIQTRNDSLAVSPEIQRAELKETVDRYTSFGYESYKQKDFRKAKALFVKALELDTLNVANLKIYELLGTCYLQLGISDSSEYYYKLGQKRRPNQYYFYHVLGYIFKNSGRIPEAIQQYQKLTELKPDSAIYYKELGSLYLLQDQSDSAIASYAQAVSLNPNDQQAKEILIKLYNDNQNIDGLISVLSAAIQNDPTDIQKRIELAEAYLNLLGQPEKSIIQLDTVLTTEPNNLIALKLIAKSNNMIEEFSEALKYYDKILVISPDDMISKCELALVHSNLDQFAKALSTVQQVINNKTNIGIAHLTKGKILEQYADHCSENREIIFDDKLVYKAAYDNYLTAVSDPQYSTEAKTNIQFLEPHIPTKEDKFMHKNETLPKSECYDVVIEYLLP